MTFAEGTGSASSTPFAATSCGDFADVGVSEVCRVDADSVSSGSDKGECRDSQTIDDLDVHVGINRG